MSKICVECAHYSAERPQLCTVPEVIDLTKLIFGTTAKACGVEVAFVRLFEDLCGPSGKWWKQKEPDNADAS